MGAAGWNFPHGLAGTAVCPDGGDTSGLRQPGLALALPLPGAKQLSSVSVSLPVIG